MGYVDGSFTFPTADYLKTSPAGKLPSMRTSLELSADVMAANFRINNIEIGAGFSALYNTRSLIAGRNFLRQYSGFGFSIGAQYHFKGIFSLGGKFRYLFCEYRPFRNRFDIAEFEVLPGFDLTEKNNFELSITVPVKVCFKADSVSTKIGVGLDFQYDVVFGAKHEKNN